MKFSQPFNLIKKSTDRGVWFQQYFINSIQYLTANCFQILFTLNSSLHVSSFWVSWKKLSTDDESWNIEILWKLSKLHCDNVTLLPHIHLERCTSWKLIPLLKGASAAPAVAALRLLFSAKKFRERESCNLNTSREDKVIERSLPASAKSQIRERMNICPVVRAGNFRHSDAEMRWSTAI